MRAALMQPYFFPYIGYYELVMNVDVFVFYDDAAFTKNSWFNRNRVIATQKEFEYIRVAVEHSTLGTPSNKIRLSGKQKDLERCINLLKVYSRCKNYELGVEVMKKTFEDSGEILSEIAASSIRNVCSLLGHSPTFLCSSELSYDRAADAQGKVISICSEIGATKYVNLSGGINLYDRSSFLNNGLDLVFMEKTSVNLSRDDLPAIENLSIIDPLIRSGPGAISEYFSERRGG